MNGGVTTMEHAQNILSGQAEAACEDRVEATREGRG